MFLYVDRAYLSIIDKIKMVFNCQFIDNMC